jgi:3-methyladenine DNA glycosylase AlkD
MTLNEALKELKALGDAKVRAQNSKPTAFGQGAGENQFGVPLGEIRKVAKKVKLDHALAMELWDTGNVDAQFLATLVIDVKKLTVKDLYRMVKSISYFRVSDWLNSYVISKHAGKDALREKWMTSKDQWAARSGWHLTGEKVAKDPEGLDLPALLDRIEKELADAVPEVQWTMNNTLANIGIHIPKLRKRALAIGEKIGLYKDWPVSKGCTPPYAPIWIDFMVKRQG